MAIVKICFILFHYFRKWEPLHIYIYYYDFPIYSRGGIFRFLMRMATWVFVRVSPSSFAVVVTLRPSAVSSWSEVSTIIREGQLVLFCVFYAFTLKPGIFGLLIAVVRLFSPWKVRPVWTLSRCFWPCSLFWLSPWDARAGVRVQS